MADSAAKRRLLISTTASPPKPKHQRGYGSLHLQHVRKALTRLVICDFDFLEPGEPTSDPVIIL